MHFLSLLHASIFEDGFTAAYLESQSGPKIYKLHALKKSRSVSATHISRHPKQNS